MIYFAQAFYKAPDPNFGQRSSNITKDGAIAADLIAKSFDQLWQDTFKGQLYASIANLGALFALGTLLIFMVQWAKTMLEGDDSKALSEMIWPLIVIFLLAGHGKNLASATLGLRGIIQETNKTLLETTSASIRLQEAYQEVMEANGDADTVRQYQIECEAKSNPQEEKQCYEKSIKEAEKIAKDAKSKNEQTQEEGVSPIGEIRNLLKQILNFRQSFGQLVMRGVLFGIAAAFQWIIEISLLVTGLLGPLAVGGSLLPIGKKPIIAWLTAFFSIGLVKVCYNMISGLVAIIMFTSNNVFDSMTFPLIIGFFAPILSLALAAGGGLSVLNGMSSIASSGISNLVMIKNLNRK